MTTMYLAYSDNEFKAKQNAIFDDPHQASRYADNIRGTVLPLPFNPHVARLIANKRHYYIELDLSDLLAQSVELSHRFDSTGNYGFMKESTKGPALGGDTFNFFYLYTWASSDQDAIKQAQDTYRRVQAAGLVPVQLSPETDIPEDAEVQPAGVSESETENPTTV